MKVISVRLTEEEDKALEEYAQRCEISKNQAIKRLILGEEFVKFIIEFFNLSALDNCTHAVSEEIYKQLREHKIKWLGKNSNF